MIGRWLTRIISLAVIYYSAYLFHMYDGVSDYLSRFELNGLLLAIVIAFVSTKIAYRISGMLIMKEDNSIEIKKAVHFDGKLFLLATLISSFLAWFAMKIFNMIATIT